LTNGSFGAILQRSFNLFFSRETVMSNENLTGKQVLWGLLGLTIAGSILFVFCSGVIQCQESDIAESIANSHDYESAVAAMQYVVFDRNEDGTVDWPSCAMSVRIEFYLEGKDGPTGIQLPDGHNWVLTDNPTKIRAFVDERLSTKPEYAEHSFAEILIFTEAVPYGTCRWQCDPEENPERCLVRKP
jgi:hypothetical protein